MSNKLKMAGLSLALILGACGGPSFTQAEQACLDRMGMAPSYGIPGVKVVDNGQSIIIGGLASWNSIRCILEEVGAPESVIERVGKTNSLMGVQEAEWGGVVAHWSKSPRGASIVLEKK